MRKILLLWLAVFFPCFALPYHDYLKKSDRISSNSSILNTFISIVNARNMYPLPIAFEEVKTLLRQFSPVLSEAVIEKVLTSLMCSSAFNLGQRTILTVIDYSKPSNEKRLWVFDLKAKKLLFYTYVSHGLKSGGLLTQFFSNKHDSKASSIGIYRTEKTYYGRDGLALRLDGLDTHFNDNASSRAVVMHGGWYVEEPFIKKYGRAGRSWGCPALPLALTKPIINTIKDNTLFVAYYPSDEWFTKSKFLNCGHFYPTRMINKLTEYVKLDVKEEEHRENILFADANQNNKRDENEAVLVMPAGDYIGVFKTAVPLERMLRRQINQNEYVALSQTEFQELIAKKNVGEMAQQAINALALVIPMIKMRHGYYATEMVLLNLGKIKDIKWPFGEHVVVQKPLYYTVFFENKSVVLRPTNRFIRWVGL